MRKWKMFICRKLTKTLCGRHGFFLLLLATLVYSIVLHGKASKPVIAKPFKRQCKPIQWVSQKAQICKYKSWFRSLPTRPANKKVLLFGDDGHVCDNIRGFLEAVRIGYSHVKNFDSDISVLPKLYDRNSNPDFASVIFCSFRNSYRLFHAGPLPLITNE